MENTPMSYEKFKYIMELLIDFIEKRRIISDFFEKELMKDSWCIFTFGNTVESTLINMLADEFDCWYAIREDIKEFDWWNSEAGKNYGMENEIEAWLYAIDEEYDYLSKNKTKMLLLEGKELYQEEEGFVYSFKTLKEIGIPDSTPVVVYNNGKSYLGEVLYTESDEIVLYVKGKLNLREKIEFSSAVQELLKALANKIRNIDYNDFLIRSLLNGKDYLTSSALIIKGQDNAIINSTSQPITIVWGPPGTGKTFTLAEIAMKMYKNGKSVLILSQSNIAVDNAMLEIKKRTSLIDEVKIFRAGYSKVK